MKMTDLVRYHIPPEIIALWRARESETLLPLQELAVKRYNLFERENLLIQAPTSSGKTFIGEMAAIHTALRRRKVVYLVPLKALAEEKFHHFHEKYARYGIKVIISTRDHREQDHALEMGDFSIAVVVYEKLAQLLVRRPERLRQLDLVIADEAELLSDPERGAMAEILLTRILQAKCRVIGLSAVIGGAERLAQWMGATLVHYERRPVELRFGVLHNGVFKYRTYNDQGEGEEQLAPASGDHFKDILSQNVQHFARRGEACLVFVKAKHESRNLAEYLADRLSLPAAENTIDRLKTSESTKSRQSLLGTLSSGVAFHNADLSPEERRHIEQGFRGGEVKVLVSTSTLAVGLNMPAQNVFIAAEKWRFDARLGIPWKAPIQRNEYENMSGRAGRYGAGHPFGRSILIAPTPFDQETLWRRYVEGEREHIDPRLGREPLEDHILRLIASRFCRTVDEVLRFLESTLTGQWVWSQTCTLDEIEFRVRAAINRCADAGMLIHDPLGALEATPYGFAIASKGIGMATARDLEEWVVASENRAWHEMDLFYAAAVTPDGKMLQVMLTAQEYERGNYPLRAKQLLREEELVADVPMNRLRNSQRMPFFEEVRALKIALFLREWIDLASVSDIEHAWNTMGGQILAAADQISWLIDAAAAIAQALGMAESFIERIETLAQRVQAGVREDVLPLAISGKLDLTRAEIAALYRKNLHTSGAIQQASVSTLKQHVRETEVQKLKAWARETADNIAPAKEVTPALIPLSVLVIDDSNPGEIVLDNAAIRLQEKQYLLIRALAAQPGKCVPYERIYQAIWGDDVVVEAAQMHFQRSKLMAAITAALPNRAGLIKTVPKRGFALQLAPEEVALITDSISTAA